MEQKQASLRKTNWGLRVGNSDKQSASGRLAFLAVLKTRCHSERSEESRSDLFVLASSRARARFFASLRMTALEGFSVHGKKVFAPG